MLLLHHYQPLIAAAVAKLPSAPWARSAPRSAYRYNPLRFTRGGAARSHIPGRRLRLRVSTPARRGAGGCGPCLQLHACPTDARRATSSVPTPTPLRAEADALAASTVETATVTDAVAPGRRCTPGPRARPRARERGPWGTVVLADLGADVIKVDPLHDFYG